MKLYTRDEFAKSLIDLCEGAPDKLAEYVEQINGWIGGGRCVAEYHNGMLAPSSFYDRRYRSFRETEDPPKEIGDSQGLSARYRLEGAYIGEALDLPAMLRELKIPRPAVAYIKTMSEEDGTPRQGWAVYRDQKLVEFVRDIGGDPIEQQAAEDRLKELGAEKAWATGEIDVTEDVWEEITNEDNWPPTSRKFSSHRAERLYGYTLESGQDEDLGDSDWGWFALFKDELSILEVDSRGFVSVSVHEDDTALAAEWDSLCEAWDADNDEGEDEK